MWFDEDDKKTGEEPMRETAVVAENWLTPQKGRSHWPPQFKETMMKMPVNSSCSDYEVEIRGIYDSYPKARMKLLKAVETDNFESAPESRTKRKKKVPKRLDDSSSEPDDSDARCFLSSPPKIYHEKNKKNIPKENKKVVIRKNNQDIKLGRPSSGSSISTMDSLPKQKSSSSFVEKSPLLKNTSHIYMPLKKSAKPTCFMNKMKNKQYDISDDSTSRSETESSAVASQINPPPNDFDNVNYEEHYPIFSKAHNVEYFNPDSSLLITPYVQRNRQVSESQPRDYTEKNSQVNESLPRNSARRLISFERSPRHHNISPPEHLKRQYERSNNNMRVMSTQRIQGNSYHLQTPASMSRQQSYPFDGVQRTFQEIIKNQEEIKAKLGNHDAMLENILMHVGNDESEQLTKPQGWPDIFPLPDVEAFLKFESFLEKKKNFSFTVKYLALKCYTSNSCEEMTRNICRYIFSKDLKKKLNWRGTSIKSGLKTTKTGSLISDTVLLKYKSSGLHVVTKTISTWLRNNIISGEKNSREQNEEENEDEYSDN